MKEKKSKGLRKVFLMAVATALVIAISVSATLAFLTDSTNQRDNVFRGATAEIQGQIIEPSFNDSNTYYYSPGHTTNKDPMVQNDSTGDPIYTGVKIKFTIQTEDGETPVTVPLETFAKYATLNNLNIDFGTSALNTKYGGASSNKWKFIKEDGNVLYLYYDRSIDITDGATGTASAPGRDTTEPIFKSVTMSPYINIPQNTSMTTVANTSSGIADAADWLNASVASGQTVQNQYRQEFAMCDLHIHIAGYAVPASAAAAVLNPSNTDDAAVITAITDGLDALAFKN